MGDDRDLEEAIRLLAGVATTWEYDGETMIWRLGESQADQIVRAIVNAAKRECLAERAKERNEGRAPSPSDA